MCYNHRYFAIFLSLIVNLVVNCQCSGEYRFPIIADYEDEFSSSSSSSTSTASFASSSSATEEDMENIPRERIPCEIPNEDKPGVCLGVSKCAAYLQVRNSSNLPAEKVNFLKKVQCVSNISFDENRSTLEPLVCCTANGQDYRYPSLKFTKFEYRRFQDATARFKKKKLKRRIQTVEPIEGGFNLWNECGKQVTHRIYGGEIAELDEFPWLALLVYNTSELDIIRFCKKEKSVNQIE